MQVSKSSSQTKTLVDMNVDLPPAGDIKKSGIFAPSAVLEQIRAERDRLEKYTQEQHARLSKLRELLISEKAGREKELAARKEELDRQVQLLQERWKEPDFEVARQKLRQELREETDQVIGQRDAALAEVQKLLAQLNDRRRRERGEEGCDG